jgi:hypothetical protein
MAAAAVYGGDHQTQLQQQHPDVHPSSAFDTTQFTDCLPLYALAKAEEDEDEYAYATAASPASLHHYNKVSAMIALEITLYFLQLKIQA